MFNLCHLSLTKTVRSYIASRSRAMWSRSTSIKCSISLPCFSPQDHFFTEKPFVHSVERRIKLKGRKLKIRILVLIPLIFKCDINRLIQR